jgi:hypothetical protein
MPANLTSIQILGNNVISAYSAPHTWFSGMNLLSLSASTNILSSTVVDNLLIDLAAAGMTNGSSVDLRGTFTGASLAARTSLTAGGTTLNITP